MTMAESSKIVTVLTLAYPIQYRDMTETKLMQTIKFWQMMLAEKDYAEVNNALKTFITTDTKGFPPTVGQVIDNIEKLKEIANPDKYINESEAWGLVRKAITNSTYNSVEEFNKLPEIVQKAVGTPSNLRELAMTEDFNTGVESSNFKRNYRATVERQKEIEKIPKNVLAIQQQAMAKLEDKES